MAFIEILLLLLLSVFCLTDLFFFWNCSRLGQVPHCLTEMNIWGLLCKVSYRLDIPNHQWQITY